MAEWIGGRNAVNEVLAAGRRRAFRLQVARGTRVRGKLQKILETCDQKQIPVEFVDRAHLDGLAAAHQGVAVRAEGYPYVLPDEIYEAAGASVGLPLVLLLDQVQDPQNLGTLIRTAEVLGIDGILLPPRRAAGITPAVVQASSGACEHLKIARINLVQAMQRLKAQGLWLLGLDTSENARSPSEIRLDVPLAIVVGSEGSGLRRLVRDSCDDLMQFRMHGAVGSLNAAVAGSIALYLARQAGRI